MPSWTIKMPSLKLSPEHFMINDDSRNFVKEQIERASDGTDETKTKDTKTYKQDQGKKNKQNFRMLLILLLVILYSNNKSFW